MKEEIKVVIPAAGESGRMNSAASKAGMQLLGRSMLEWVVCAAREIDPQPTVLLRPEDEGLAAGLNVKTVIGSWPDKETALREEAGSGLILALPCDMPLLTGESLRGAVEEALKKGVFPAACGELMLTRADDFVEARAGLMLPEEEALDVNDRIDLSEAIAVLKKRILFGHMRAGVTVIDPETTYIDADVVIGRDTVIYPGNHITGKSVIGSGCILYPGSFISDSILGDGVTLRSSTLQNASVGARTTVGPNAYLRPDSRIGEGCRIGDFVEVKNSVIGDGTKVSHLTYVGDADLGRNINVGCGVVFVNYDGYKKHRSTVGDNAFIGCNTNLVAPVHIEKGGFTAAGTTVTDDVPENALAIARSRQTNIEGWVERYRSRQTEKE